MIKAKPFYGEQSRTIRASRFVLFCHIRSILDMSQVELGLLLGKSRSTIQRWEKDQMKLDIDAVKNEMNERANA